MSERGNHRFLLQTLGQCLGGSKAIPYQLNKKTMKFVKWIFVVAWFAGGLGNLVAQNPPVLEKRLVAFEQAAQANPIPEGGTLFIGSSSVERWEKKVASLGSEPMIFRGVGGTTYAFLVKNAERLLAACKPKRVIIYSGDNDIGEGAGGDKAADTVVMRVRELVEKIEKTQPQAKIYIFGIKPSIMRAGAEPVQARANEGIRKIAEEKNGKVFYVDTKSCLLGADGKPDPEFFAPDGLHLNEKGYAKWNELLASILAE